MADAALITRALEESVRSESPLTPADDEDKSALEELEPLCRRISVLLLREASPGTARVTSNDHARSLLKLMETELSVIFAALHSRLALKERGAPFLHRQDMNREWLLGIRELAGLIGHLLDRYERPPPSHAVAVLLHRAARYCRRTTTAEPETYREMDCIAQRLAFVAQHPLMYEHRLLVSTPSRTYHIPYWLKLLLLYMVSMFPQGYKFDKNRLVWKWASEGLTGKYHWDERESQAEECFSELVDREVIIQAANYGHKPAAEVEDCRWQVNPDMLEFLASQSAEKGFVCTSGMLKSAAAGGDSSEILRRLSLHQPDPELPTLLETMDLSHTRSLAVSGAVDQIPLGKFIYLTLLDLEGWENLKDEDLRQQICSTMFLLRYLSVRNTGVTRLPPEIKELRHLEALDVSHTQIRQLPEQLVELRWLRSLLVGGDGINPDETVAKIPEGIVHIPDLRVLATVDLSEWSASSVEALVQEDLEVLAITWSFHQCADGKYRDALRSCIKQLKELKSLTIHCGLGCSMEFLGSQSPHYMLEKFKVTTGRFVTVPQWIEGLWHLSFLQITVCKLGTEDLKILGELPELQCLVLGLDFLPGEAIVFRSEEFRRLRTFSVHCLVPWLTFGEGTMPELTYLDLEIICSVPPNQDIVLSGISNLEKLREVVLQYSKWYNYSSSVKKTVEAVKKAVAKHRGRINLFINGTQHGVQAEAVDEETARKTTEIQSEIEIECEIESEAQMS